MKKSFLILPMLLALAACSVEGDPSSSLTTNPTTSGTNAPTSEPTSNPTSDPTSSPTSDPTSDPTSSPTSQPTSAPTSSPTSTPTSAPTSSPTSGASSYVPTSSPTSEASTSASVSTSSSTSIPGRQVEDITIAVTVSGIDTYQDNYAAIWLNCDSFAEGWGTYVMTRVEETNVWEIVIEDFELENMIEYAFYYGSTTSPEWTIGKCTEAAEENLYLETEEDVFYYEVTASFVVPSSTESTDIVISPVIYTKDTSSVEAILDTTVVYAWIACLENTVAFEKQTDGTWKYTCDIPVVAGIKKTSITPVLGLDSGADWNYQYGAIEGGVWVQWDAYLLEGSDFDSTFVAHFNGQPEPATGAAFTVTYVEADCTVWPTGRYLQYSTTSSNPADSAWFADLAWVEGNTYRVTHTFEDNKIYLTVGLWIESQRYGVAAENTAFEIEFSADTASITLTGTYTATQDQYVLVATDAVGCTVK